MLTLCIGGNSHSIYLTKLQFIVFSYHICLFIEIKSFTQTNILLICIFMFLYANPYHICSRTQSFMFNLVISRITFLKWFACKNLLMKSIFKGLFTTRYWKQNNEKSELYNEQLINQICKLLGIYNRRDWFE